MSRRAIRYAVGVWVALVVLGAGLTVWLEGSGQPGSAGGDRSRPSEPTPSPTLPPDEDNPCPDPSATPDRDQEGESGDTLVLCAYTEE